MRLLITLFAALALTACAASKTQIQIEQPKASVVKANQLATAGAITVDITPPPGMPMGGYSVMANKGKGFRTRIKAKIVYLNDGKGQSMALIQGDLTAASLLAHHMIAQRVAEKTGLKPENIAFTASHSHSSPVNFFDNDFYNKHTSSGAWLEQNFLELMVNQISDGIIQAYENRRPAKIATGKAEVYGLTRNRALKSYARNENVGEINLKDPEAVFKAINPDLTMIRVDALDKDGRFKPLAAFTGFSMHNTTIDVPVEVYNGDVYAYPQRDLEWTIEERYSPSWKVVHAVTQATHADMAPATPDNGNNWVGHGPVDWKSARELGQKLSQETLKLFDSLESQLTTEMSLASAARELNIRENNEIGGVEICKDAAVGAPVAAGAYERRTPWLTMVPMLHGGNWTARRWIFNGGCQGHKRILGGIGQPLLEPKDSFPNTVMFQIIKVNDSVILPLPFEVTAEAGNRISAAVEQEFAAAGIELSSAWVASVSNGYFGYTVTPEEYSNQNYEGGHTLYGKNSTPYLAGQLQVLAKDFLAQGEVAEMLPSWNYELRTNQFTPDEQAATGKREWIKAPVLVKGKKSHQEDYLQVRWQDVNISKIDLHRPLVKVEQLVDGQWVAAKAGLQPIDDEGYDVEVRVLKNAKNGMANYESRWYNPVAGGEYRFVIAERNGQGALYSESIRY